MCDDDILSDLLAIDETNKEMLERAKSEFLLSSKRLFVAKLNVVCSGDNPTNQHKVENAMMAYGIFSNILKMSELETLRHLDKIIHENKGKTADSLTSILMEWKVHYSRGGPPVGLVRLYYGYGDAGEPENPSISTHASPETPNLCVVVKMGFDVKYTNQFSFDDQRIKDKDFKDIMIDALKEVTKHYHHRDEYSHVVCHDEIVYHHVRTTLLGVQLVQTYSCREKLVEDIIFQKMYDEFRRFVQ